MLQAGARVGRHVLLAPLGRGGQGTVWRARHTATGGLVALKVVSLSDATPAELERARREATLLAQLEHASLVRCHDVFTDPSAGVLAATLDLVAGVDLEDALIDPRLGAVHRQWVLVHLASVLAALHARGLVHRDLKARNVMLADGFWARPDDPAHVKLVDFGIAVLAGNPAGLTSTGGAVGTSSCMAPEVLAPATFGEGAAAPTVDVFAFGVLAWRLLFGAHPTGLSPGSAGGDFLAAYLAARQLGVAWPPPRPESAWDRVLAGSLALEPMRRFPDGAALWAAVTALGTAPAAVEVSTDDHAQPLPGREIRAPSAGAPLTSPPTSVATWWTAAALGGGLMALLAVAVGAAWWNGAVVAEPPPSPTRIDVARAADRRGNRASVDGGCGSGRRGDAPLPPRESPLRLRPSGVIITQANKRVDLFTAHPDAVVTVCTTGSPARCTSFSARDRPFPRCLEPVLPVTLAEIRAGLDLSFRAGGTTTSGRVADDLDLRALDQGYRLTFKGGDPAFGFFLDDP